MALCPPPQSPPKTRATSANTGEPLLRAFRHPRYAVAANSLHCGGPAGSRLTLPVVPLSALPPLPDPAVEALIADTRRALADLFPTAQ